MTDTFMPGDIVRVEPDPECHLVPGSTHTVAKVIDGALDDRAALNLEGSEATMHPVAEFTRINPFHLGAEVEVVSDEYGDDDRLPIGSRHTVTKVLNGLLVEIDGNESNLWLVKRFRLVENEESTDTPADTLWNVQAIVRRFGTNDPTAMTTEQVIALRDDLTARLEWATPAPEQVDEPVDERIAAWDHIATHPFFEGTYADDGPLIDAMIARLDRLTEATTDGEASPPEPDPWAVPFEPEAEWHDAPASTTALFVPPAALLGYEVRVQTRPIR